MMQEAIRGLLLFLGYYAIAACVLLLIGGLIKPPRELFRKMLHIACVLSIFPLVYAFETWYLPVLVVVAFSAIVYPLLVWAERSPRLMALFPQRGNGEFRASLITVFAMMGLLITIFWGFLGAQWKYIVIVAVLAWGLGDAAAALVGKAFGRHPITHRGITGPKTYEGTGAMFLVALVVIYATLTLYGAAPWYFCLLIAIVVAGISATVEYFSPNGSDTITVPLATAIPTYLLLLLVQEVIL